VISADFLDCLIKSRLAATYQSYSRTLSNQVSGDRKAETP
jgi:hypothetical protein